MLRYFLSFEELLPYIVIAWLVLGVIGRYGVFKKMGIRPWLALIPGVRYYCVFKKCKRRWHFIIPMVIAGAIGFFLVAGGYIGFGEILLPYLKKILLVVMLVIILYMLIYMYKRMAFGFGHDFIYLIGLLFLNPIFLLILAFSKAEFNEGLMNLKGKALRQYLKKKRNILSKLLSFACSLAILIGASGYCGYIVLTEQMPGFLIQLMIDDFAESTREYVDGSHEVIYPLKNDTYQTNMRDLYFGDKSEVKDVVVYGYFIGSDLEEAMGLASYNLNQMIEATKQGTNLKFIIEAGGSRRWFTTGFKNRAVGRYMIYNGEVTELEQLDNKTCMSQKESLQDFLSWANQNYPADRSMLVLWNHGGGILGYGLDELNEKKEGINILSIDDIAKALEATNSKFDLIDFDACLMQTLEVGYSLEPYCDYLLASQETEPSQGQYYTIAFGKLAKDPTLSTEELSAILCSCYDQYLADNKDGSPNSANTLSLIETRKLPAIYDLFTDWLSQKASEFSGDRNVLLSFLKAAGDAYHFNTYDHIDLIDFITYCDMDETQKKQLVTMLEDAIVLRNSDSADHINGISFYLPYQFVAFYDFIYEGIADTKIEEQIEVYNTIASIMANQENPQAYVNMPWYVKGWEDYHLELFYESLALDKLNESYIIDLTDEQRDYVVDLQLKVKMKAGKYWADLGCDSHYDYFDGEHYGFIYDNTWLTINSIPVATKTITEQSSNNQFTYLSTVSAVYNFVTPINIYVERTFFKDGSVETKVLGYRTLEDEKTKSAKGYNQFKTGCLITFTYDWYDQDGKYIKTAMGHLPVRITSDGLWASQSSIESETLQYYGVVIDAANESHPTDTLTSEGH